MTRRLTQLRDDAMAIWAAGVDTVLPERLIGAAIHVDGSILEIGATRLDLDRLGRIVVVGAGKAGAGMAAAIEKILGAKRMAEKNVTGWINVPADCLQPLQRIHLHAARPAGLNEPTTEGVRGSEEILRLVSGLSAKDVCLCLLSGGGSALLPAPADGITLEDKLAVTRHLSAAGANIDQLNTVRKQLSRIKGGGLLRACRAGRLITLVISDVIGDPLDLIASGPTVEDTSTAQQALDILHRFEAERAGISHSVFVNLIKESDLRTGTVTCNAETHVIGNLATAVDAAGRAAERLGYTPSMDIATKLEGPAEDVGRHLARLAVSMRAGRGPDCLVSGGEPVVELVEAEKRGLGGRNQQLALAALIDLTAMEPDGVLLLAAGTDGEDGPTDAAGARVDEDVIAAAMQKGIDPFEGLRSNDAYHFFERAGGLIKTGPTGTNVCDLRVILVDRIENPVGFQDGGHLI